VRYIVIYYGNLMWIFKGASRSGTTVPAGDPFFLSTANTFRRMRANEFPLAQPNRLHVVRATDGTTIEQLAKESPIKDYPLQQLRLFNSLYPDGEPRPATSSRPSGRGLSPFPALRKRGLSPLLHHPATFIFSANSASAFPRWLTRFFSCAGISAAVVVPPRR